LGGKNEILLINYKADTWRGREKNGRFKWILRKQVVRMGSGLNWLRVIPLTDVSDD
jgi:hypothetical protein